MPASRRRAIKRAALKRSIADVIHFTRVESLNSILEFGLVQRDNPGSALLQVTDPQRLDGRPDCLSTSISFPNYSMFWAIRIDRFPSVEWCILALRCRIIWNMPCMFFPENAARWGPGTVRSAFRTRRAFEAMFSGQRPANLPPKYPTHPQAEVQIEKPIKTEEIKAIYFRSQHALGNWQQTNPKIPSHISIESRPSLFWNRDRYLSEGS